MKRLETFSLIAAASLFATSCTSPSKDSEPVSPIMSPKPQSAPKAIGTKYTLPLLSEGQTTPSRYLLKYNGATIDVINTSRNGITSPGDGAIRLEIDVDALKKAHEAQLPLVLERKVGPLNHTITVISSVYNEGALLEVSPFPTFQIEDPNKGTTDSCQIPGEVRHLSRYSIMAFFASFKNGRFAKANGVCDIVDKAIKNRFAQATSLQGEIDRNTTPESIELAKTKLEAKSERAKYEEVSITTVKADVRGLSSLLSLQAVDTPLQRQFLSTVFSARVGQIRDRINFLKLKGKPLEDPTAEEQIEHDMIKSLTLKNSTN